MRKALGIGSPSPSLRPVLFERIPSGIHPPMIDGNAPRQCLLYVFDLVLFRRALHLHRMARAAGRQLRRRKFPAWARQVMRDHPPPPDVLSIQPIPTNELNHPERRTHLLARQQAEVSSLLSRSDANVPRIVSRKLR